MTWIMFRFGAADYPQNTMKLLKFALTLSCFGLVSTAFAEEKVWTAEQMKEAGKTFVKVCVQCHADDGMGKAKIHPKTGKALINAMAGPRIAGLNEKYMVAQLRDVYKGARANANTISMKQKISKLKPSELKAIAHYVSQKLNPGAGSYKGMLEE